MYHTAANILDDVRSHDEFNFNGFLNMDYFHETNQDDGSHQAPLRPPETGPTVSQMPHPPIKLGNDSAPEKKSDPNKGLGLAESDVIELCIDPGIWLAGTVIFFQVLKFMTCKL